MQSTELTIVRHGETEWNLEARVQGHLDSNLTETGVAQAKAVAQRLKGKNFAALYSSDLGRAYHTAEIIAGQTGHRILTDQRLRERHLGIFQGWTWREVEKRYPDEVNSYRTSGPDDVIPGGESRRQHVHRAIACLEDIVHKHPGQSVLVVAHGGVLSGLFRHTLGIPIDAPRRFTLWNASLNTFYYEKGDWSLGSWGDVCHLAHLGFIDDA